ncbi:MAG: TldD/PmbA family protein [bacterium]|nr:TldD/PmbA family protein [bacterium]
MNAVLKKALSNADVDYAEIHLEEREVTEVFYRGKELESIGTRREYGGNVRAYHKGGWGFVSFNQLANLDDCVKSACNHAKLTSSGDGKLNFTPKVKDKISLNLKNDPRYVPLEEKELLARNYNSIIMSSPLIQSTSVVYRDTYSNRTFVNTLGSDIKEEQLYCGILLGALAKDGTNVQSASHSISKTTGYDTVLGLEKEAERVTKEACDLLKAEKVSAGVYTVVADPHLAGVFCHEAFGHLSEADHAYGNPQLMEVMKLGKRFGRDELSIIDDGSFPGQQGSYKYDDEGTPSQKTYLIKDGILSGRLHSVETAGKLNEPVTGNARAITYRFKPIVRMSCTCIEPRDKSFEEMISEIDNGIYAKESLGGMTQLEMFTFSAAKAYLIKNGKIGPMVRDVMLSGNIFKTLQDIDAIGNDMKVFGSLGGCGKDGQGPLPVSMGSPHIRIKNVVIGGK